MQLGKARHEVQKAFLQGEPAYNQFTFCVYQGSQQTMHTLHASAGHMHVLQHSPTVLHKCVKVLPEQSSEREQQC